MRKRELTLLCVSFSSRSAIAAELVEFFVSFAVAFSPLLFFDSAAARQMRRVFRCRRCGAALNIFLLSSFRFARRCGRFARAPLAA